MHCLKNWKLHIKAFINQIINTSATIDCELYKCDAVFVYMAMLQGSFSNAEAFHTIEDTLDGYMVHIRLLNGLS